MTTGERIAALRKEKAMSQEALGEALGVSRQAISKWESDASLPEIEKLVQLSKIFGVPVGYLLGVEENGSRQDDELTEEQLRMAERIAGKYIEAFPPPPAPGPMKLPKWAKFAAAAAALVLVGLLYFVVSLSDEVSILRRENWDIQERVSQISSNVNWAVNDMTDRMEQILKKQNSVLADYGYNVKYADYATGDIQLELYAVPRDYAEGMTANFSMDDVSVVAEYVSGRFVGQLTLNMYEDLYDPKYYVHFGKDGISQTQLLEEIYVMDGIPHYSMMLSNTGETMMLWGMPVEQFNDRSIAKKWIMNWTVTEVVGQTPAGENHSALYAENFGVVMLKNDEVFFKSPVYELTPAQQRNFEPVFISEGLDIPYPTVEEGDELHYVSGIMDNNGRLHISEHTVLRAEGDSLDFAEGYEYEWGVQIEDVDFAPFQALKEHLQGK